MYIERSHLFLVCDVTATTF